MLYWQMVILYSDGPWKFAAMCIIHFDHIYLWILCHSLSHPPCLGGSPTSVHIYQKKRNLGGWRSPPKSPISHSDLTHPIPNPTPEKALQKSVPPWGFSRPHLQLYKTWQPYMIPPLPPQGSPRSCSALLRLSLDLIWFITSVAASLLGDLNFSPPPAGPFPFPR